MYKLLVITQSKLRAYGKGNHFNYLGDDHFILRGGGWQILTGQNIYFQFFAGQQLYFRLLQDRLFISGYNNVGSGGQARLFFLFSWAHRPDYLFSSFWQPEYLFKKTVCFFNLLFIYLFIFCFCFLFVLCVCVCVLCRDILTTL